MQMLAGIPGYGAAQGLRLNWVDIKVRISRSPSLSRYPPVRPHQCSLSPTQTIVICNRSGSTSPRNPCILAAVGGYELCGSGDACFAALEVSKGGVVGTDRADIPRLLRTEYVFSTSCSSPPLVTAGRSAGCSSQGRDKRIMDER